MRLVSGLSGTILSYLYLTKTKRPGETLGIRHSKNVCAGGNPGSSIRLFIYQNGNEYEFQWELWSMQLSYPIIQIDANCSDLDCSGHSCLCIREGSATLGLRRYLIQRIHGTYHGATFPLPLACDPIHALKMMSVHIACLCYHAKYSDLSISTKTCHENVIIKMRCRGCKNTFRN